MEFTLTDAIQTLITAGHSWSDIRGYTLEQIRCFNESVIKVRNLELRRFMFAMHVASQGSTKSVNSYAVTLEPGNKTEAKKLKRMKMRDTDGR